MTGPHTQQREIQPRTYEPRLRERRQNTMVGGGPRVVAIAARLITGALVIATGAIHLYLYHLYFSAVPTIGRLFLLNFVASVVLGVLIVVLRSPWWSLIGAGFCLATLGAFLISVHWGLAGYQETLHGTWQERAAVIELAGGTTGVIAAALARRQDRRSA